MKNLSTLFIAIAAVLAGVILLNAQNNSSQNEYNNNSTSDSDSVNQSDLNQLQQVQKDTWSSTVPSKVYTQWVSQAEKPKPSYETYENPKVLKKDENGKYVPWTDNEIAQKIRWAIRDDWVLSQLSKTAEVSVKNRNVILRGIASNEEEKNRISALARQTQGVKSVSNNIVISNR